METLRLEEAVQIYDAGVQKFPNDALLLDAYTDVLLQME